MVMVVVVVVPAHKHPNPPKALLLLRPPVAADPVPWWFVFSLDDAHKCVRVIYDGGILQGKGNTSQSRQKKKRKEIETQQK